MHPSLLRACHSQMWCGFLATDAHAFDGKCPLLRTADLPLYVMQVPQLFSKACRQLAPLLAQAGCPAAALLALHDCHGAAVRQQFAAVVRGKQLALARRSDAEGAAAGDTTAAGLQFVEAQLQHAWRDMQQLSLQGIEVSHTSTKVLSSCLKRLLWPGIGPLLLCMCSTLIHV